MSRLNEPANYLGRVSFARAVISLEYPTDRDFDNCFENLDGDAVVAALVRIARKDRAFAAKLWRYVDRATAEECASPLDGKNLPQEAARMREAYALA